MRAARTIVFLFFLLAAIGNLRSQVLLGVHVNAAFPLIGENLAEYEYKNTFSVGLNTWRWRPGYQDTRFKINAFSYRHSDLSNSFMEYGSFVKGEMKQFTWEYGFGRIWANQEADDRFYLYSYFSILLGVGIEEGIRTSHMGMDNSYEELIMNVEPLNWTFGVNQALGNRFVLRGEAKFHTGGMLYSVSPALQMQVQTQIAFKLY
jgi:hypothetical protein